MKVQVLLGVIALGAVGLLLNLWVMRSKRKLWESLATVGLEVRGQVSDRRMVKVSSYGARPAFDITYADSNASQHVLRDVFVEGTLAVGNEVVVRFDPNNPTVAALEPRLNTVRRSDLIVICVLFLGLGIGLAFAA